MKKYLFIFIILFSIIIRAGDINVNGYVLKQYNATWTFTLPDTTIPEGWYMVIGRDATQSDFETFWGITLPSNVIYINSAGKIPQINGDEIFVLQNNTGTTIDSTWFTMTTYDTYQRDSTNVNTWTISDDSFANPGSGANGGFNKGLIINEASDASGTGNYVYEFIELFNDSSIGTKVLDLFNTPQTPDTTQTVLITCYFESDTTINYCNLIWTRDDFSTTDTANMTLKNDSTFEYILPNYTAGTHVKYYVQINDNKNRTLVYPDYAPTYYKEYIVPSWTEFFEIHFNLSVDNSVYQKYLAEGYDSLDFYMAKYIGSATKSVSACFYDLDRQIVADSLIAAHNRGVNVRFITDADNRGNLQVQQLESAGIPVIDDTFPDSYAGSYIMHNKFCIIDSQIVLSGSYNVTDNGTDKNANNLVVIKDIYLANNYAKEFNEMWGSDSMIPSSSNSKFSTAKYDNITHTFIIDNDTVEVYMSPSDGVAAKMIDAINTADKSIYFCIFSFTRQDIADAMKTKYDAGVDVRGVFDGIYWDADYSKSLDLRGIYNSTSSNNPWSPPADVFEDNTGAVLHHKYMLIDVDNWQSNPIIITGSYNWSNNAETGNDENILFIHSTYFADLFLQEFAARYAEAGGTRSFVIETGINNTNMSITRENKKVRINYSLETPCIREVYFTFNNSVIYRTSNKNGIYIHENTEGGEYEMWGLTNANNHILLAKGFINQLDNSLIVISENKLFTDSRIYKAKLLGTGNIKVNIYNINGSIVYSKNMNLNNNNIFNLEKNLPEGIYIAEYKNNFYNIKEKIIKIR